MSRQLPAQPHLGVLKKQARQLLKDHQAADPEAVERVQAVVADLPPSASEKLTLRHAQQVLAREYGFTSWQALAEHVGQPADETPSGPSSALPPHYEDLARNLVSELEGQGLPAYGQLSEAFRTRVREGVEESRLLEQARLAIAATSGCATWAELAQRANDPAKAMMDLPQLQGFERLHEELARLLTTRIGALPGTPSVQAKLAFTDQTTYGEFILSQGAGTRAYQYVVDDLGSDIVLSLGPSLAEVLAPPTTGEAAVQGLGDDLARDLEAVWSTVTRFTVTGAEAHTDPWAIGASPLYRVCALQAIEVAVEGPHGQVSGLVEVCYPVGAIHGVLDRLPAVT